MTLRYEGVRFSDGSIAVRRLADDPCDRASSTFESMRELEEDIGSADVTWIADRLPTAPPVPRDPIVITDHERFRELFGSLSALGKPQRPFRPVSVGYGPSRYEPTEGIDE